MIHKTRGTGVEWMGSEIARRAGYANSMTSLASTLRYMAHNGLIEGRKMPFKDKHAHGWMLTHAGALRALQVAASDDGVGK